MMTDSLIYNIPVDLVERYRGQRVIVRAFEPAKLIGNIRESDFPNLEYVQLLNLDADAGVLTKWGIGVPIDLVMSEPEIEPGRLYKYAKLLDKHPVRVTIPVGRGFASAVKIAALLDFQVKLTVFQPSAKDLVEMFEVMVMFLHKPTFTQPVEFYQSSLRSFFHDDSQSVWSIQEEDPSENRYITDDDIETISPRFLDARAFPGRSLETFIDDFKLSLLAERHECEKCEFLTHCQGYFKWSDKNYPCVGGIKTLFSTLKAAAVELEGDLALYAESGG